MKGKALVFAAVMLLAGIPLFAAYDAFLKIDGVQGESKDAAHQGWIDVLSFSWGVTQATGGGGSGRAAEPHDFTITKRIDKSSPKLMDAATRGMPFPNVTLDVNGERHMLQGVMVKSVRQTAMGDSMRQTIDFTFQRCATHEGAGSSNTMLKYEHKTGYLKIDQKVIQNGMFSLGGGPQGPIILQDIHFLPSNQAVVAVREAAAGILLPAVRRALQSRQKLPQLVLSGYQTGGSDVFDKDHKSANQTFTFQGVTISSITNVGGFDQITLKFDKFDGPMAGFHNIFPK